jgi:nitroimidazol reductase NimA-like FMN-containing flavoprotein (pyridoxamine 5'-phosphate oxidase superfamily)
MAHDEPAVSTLTEDECWDLLVGQEFGRMAYHDGDGVSLVPINFAVDERHRRIVFRTAAGSKLPGVMTNAEVAFEVDHIGDDTAASVVVHGSAHELTGAEAAWADVLPLRPWVPTEKSHVIAIEPNDVAGRRFHLDRPWRHIRPLHPVAPRVASAL